MSARILVLLVLVATIIMACGGSSKSTPTATPSETSAPVPSATAEPATVVAVPFTPVEEVLTPPPDIDTSGWLTYRDEQNGFELKYLPEITARKGEYEPNPLAGSTALGVQFHLPDGFDDYLFVRVDNVSPVQCVPEPVVPVGANPTVQAERAVRLLHAPGAEVYKRFDAGAAASQRWYVTTYMTNRNGACVVMHGVVSSVSDGVFATPPGPDWYAAFAARKAADEELFAAMVATFRWLD